MQLITVRYCALLLPLAKRLRLRKKTKLSMSQENVECMRKRSEVRTEIKTRGIELQQENHHHKEIVFAPELTNNDNGTTANVLTNTIRLSFDKKIPLDIIFYVGKRVGNGFFG